jgi:hypothetical protein
VTQILRQDIGVSETQRAVNPAGFKDAYAYEIQKATKRLAIKLEKAVFQAVTSASGASGTSRTMKSLQTFITTNTGYAGTNGFPAAMTASTVGTSTTAGTLAPNDFNAMLQTIYTAGGNPEQCYVSPAVKRQISAFTLTQQNRNIAAAEKKLVAGVDMYDSDFGLIQIVLDRWVPQATNTAYSAGTDVTGVLFFLQRSINRLAWLRPMQHSLIGKRGDSVAGIVVGEVTLEVLNQLANGMISSCSNKSPSLGV